MTTATTMMPTRDVTIGDTFVRISGQGFPLVFVHGFTTTSEFWREQAEEFSKAYRVIRIGQMQFSRKGASLPAGRLVLQEVQQIAARQAECISYGGRRRGAACRHWQSRSAGPPASAPRARAPRGAALPKRAPVQSRRPA